MENPVPPVKKVARARTGKVDYKAVRGDFVWVYKQLGGKKALLTWAAHSKDAQETFYKELLRLMPKEIAEIDNPIGNIKLNMFIDEKEPGGSNGGSKRNNTQLPPEPDLSRFS